MLSYTLSHVLNPLLPQIEYKINGFNIGSTIRSVPAKILTTAISYTNETILAKIDNALAPRLNINKGIIPLLARTIGMSVAGQIIGYNPWFIGSLVVGSILSHSISPTTQQKSSTSPPVTRIVTEKALSSSIGFSVKFMAKKAVSAILPINTPIFDALASSVDKTTSKLGKTLVGKLYSRKSSEIQQDVAPSPTTKKKRKVRTKPYKGKGRFIRR